MNKKRIISYVLSFVMAVSLGICGLASGIYMGFFYSGSTQTAFEEIDGTDGVRQRVIDGIDYSNVPYGMDVLVFERIVTHDMIHEDVKSYVGSRFAGEQFELEEKRQKNLETSYFSGTDYMLREKGIEITPEGDEAIRNYFNTFREHYVGTVQFEGIKVFADLSKTYGRGLLIVAGVFGAIAVATGIALWLTGTERGKTLVLSLLGGGVMVAIVPAYLLLDKSYLRVVGGNQLIYDFYVRMFRNGFANIVAIGFILIVIGVAAGIYQFLKKD